MSVISVIMPVFNGEKYLREALESVLRQSFKDFEFIIINDGSTDKTEEIIRSYNDRRIIYIKNKGNLGLAKSFNIGIKTARGEFIARMDADDINMEERFEIQREFLENHLDTSIVGSAIIRIDETGERRGVSRRPTTHEAIKWQSLFSTPLFHPTIMARTKVLKNNLFDENLHNSEDYELWSRLLFNTRTKFANLSEPLLYYRVFPQSFTQKLDIEKREASARNSIRNIEKYIILSPKEKELIVQMRKDERLSIGNYFSVWMIYLKVAKKFRNSFAYWKLIALSFSLKKRWLKQYLR